MDAAFGVVAFLVALVGLLVALGNAAYLSMLSSAAKGRGISGEPTANYVREQRTQAGILLAVALVGLLLTVGETVPDVIGLVLGAASGVAGYRALGVTRRRFRGGQAG